MGYLERGQYRYVEYDDDGCDRYQCLWCFNDFVMRDNPEYWNFCPKCGRSWFKKADCRPREIPRWAWDRGHREWFDGMYPIVKKKPIIWFIEFRTRWPEIGKRVESVWTQWMEDGEVYGNDWQSAARQLAYRRTNNEPEYPGDMEFEYRAFTRREQ